MHERVRVRVRANVRSFVPTGFVHVRIYTNVYEDEHTYAQTNGTRSLAPAMRFAVDGIITGERNNTTAHERKNA